MCNESSDLGFAQHSNLLYFMFFEPVKHFSIENQMSIFLSFSFLFVDSSRWFGSVIRMKNVASSFFILLQLENPDVKPGGRVADYKERLW